MNNPERKYSTLLFDADGTLLDFDEAERRGAREIMRTYGVEPTDALVMRYHQVNLDHWRAFERGDISREDIFLYRYPRFFAEIGVEVSAAEVEPLYRRLLDSCAATLPGALQICAYLKERGYDLYIVTNGTPQTQYRRLDDSGLSRYFLDIFVSESTGSQKPQPEYFNYCFARIREQDRARMLLIGDSLSSDIRGANNVGIGACWLNLEGLTPPGDLRIDYEIADLMELKKFL